MRKKLYWGENVKMVYIHQLLIYHYINGGKRGVKKVFVWGCQITAYGTDYSKVSILNLSILSILNCLWFNLKKYLKDFLTSYKKLF